MSAHDSAFRYRPPAEGPDLCHADEAVVAVHKPSGLLSVPGRGPEHQDSAVLRLQAIWGPLWVVHRLDMDTSGLILYARSQAVAATLGRAFERRLVHKHYRALVHGCPPQTEGLIDLPLRLDWPHRPRQIVDAQEGKPSTTRWRLLAAEGAGARLQLEPITGRSHQLRVHLAASGFPIQGDRFYGRDDAVPRLMLHARSLELPHPLTGEPLRLECPEPF